MKKFLANLEKISKICSIICGIFLILLSVQRLMHLNVIQIKDFILSFHYIILASFLVLSEFHLDFVSKYFKLIDGIIGRGIYITFLGTLIITNPNEIAQFLLSILFMIVGVSYIIMGLIKRKDNPNQQKLVEYVQKEENEVGEIPSVPEIKL